MRTNRALALVALPILLLTVAAGCGSDQKSHSVEQKDLAKKQWAGARANVPFLFRAKNEAAIATILRAGRLIKTFELWRDGPQLTLRQTFFRPAQAIRLALGRRETDFAHHAT